MSAVDGRVPAQAKADSDYRGRVVESAERAHLTSYAAAHALSLHYWREGDLEVDYVLESEHGVVAIEVKSGRSRTKPAGLDKFSQRFGRARKLLVGPGGIELDEFLLGRGL